MRPIIPIFKVAMSPNVDSSLIEVLHSGYIGEGPKVAEFENELEAKFKTPYCLALNSGTAGLQLALALLKIKNKGVGKGKVLTTALSCFATISPALTEGYDIEWVDIQKDTLNIDPKSLKDHIHEDISAIIFVHWGGYPADLEEIHEIASEYNVPVIEDAAHTLGATYKDTIIGDCTYSDYCMISFQAIKHLTTGDGGVLFTKYQKDYELGKLLRWFGIDRNSPLQDMRCYEDILHPGYKMQMNDLCATIGLANFELVEKNILIAKENVKEYREAFKDISGITLLQNGADRESSNWLFTILVEDPIGFARIMGENNIMISKVHSRLDNHSCVKEYKFHLPVFDSIDNNRICIPCGWWVTKEDREYIISVIKKGW